jgi:hypothetical protein
MNTPKRQPLTIKEGDHDGVNVFIDQENRRAVVKLPNNFDVYFMFGRRDDNGKPYAERFESKDKAKAVFCIEFQDLGNDNKVRDFNQKVLAAREISKELTNEIDLYETVIAFDYSEGKKARYKYLMPQSGYAIGEVVHAGKYFAVLGQGIKDEEKFFQVVKTNAILSGRDEFLNREETVKAKLPLGATKFLGLSETGRIVVSDPKPRQEAAPALEVTLPITREQKEALMAYRESKGDDWKEKLNEDWANASYPGVTKAHAPLLQQVRNQQGPEWLSNLKDKDLYLGITQEPAKVEPKKPAVKKAKSLEKEM